VATETVTKPLSLRNCRLSMTMNLFLRLMAKE